MFGKMIASLRTAFRTWTPWEEAVTAAVLTKLNDKSRETLSSQLVAVNKVQRLLGWREIDLYVMKKGKVERRGLPVLFDDREFVLAKVVTKTGERQIHTSLNCVGGHLFSFESDQKVRPIAFCGGLRVEVSDMDRRFT
jgi:hypothetical protein